MKVQVRRLLGGLVLCGWFVGTVHAQSGDPAGSIRVSDQAAASRVPVGEVPLPSAPAPVPLSAAPGGTPFPLIPVDNLFRPTFRLDTRGGNLAGYSDGYTNFVGFVPWLFDDDSVLFLDGRGTVTYNGGGGANVGLGLRKYAADMDRVWGVSMWWDHDTGHARAYNQIGVSAESLGRYVDYRLNGYIPIGDRQHVLGVTPLSANNYFGNFISILQATHRETQLGGFDGEIGGPVPLLGRYGASAYTGLYYLTGPNTSSVTGVSARAAFQINEDLLFGIQQTWDHVFQANTQFQVQITLPDGMPSRWLRQKRVRDRLVDPVWRNYRIAVRDEVVNSNVAAINPADGLPYFVAHINPNVTTATAGNGTVENPFRSVDEYINSGLASNFDIILVQPYVGTGPTLPPGAPALSSVELASFNLTVGQTGPLRPEGLQLFDNQRLLGSTSTHDFVTGGRTFTLPGVPGAPTSFPNGIFPTLRNADSAAGSRVITLADNNEVSGFGISGSNSATIASTAVVPPFPSLNRGIVSDGLISGFNINRNIFTNVSDGVVINHSAGAGLAARGVINDNTFTGANAASNTAISITNTNGTLDYLARANTITNFRGEDVNNNGVLDPLEDRNGNGVLDRGQAMRVVSNGAGSVIRANNLTGTIPGPFGVGVVTANTQTGILGGATEDANNNGTLDPGEDTNGNGLLDGRTITGNGSGVEVVAVNGGEAVVGIDGLVVTNSTDPNGFGVALRAINAGVMTVENVLNTEISNTSTLGTTITRAGGDGLVLEARTGATGGSVLNVLSGSEDANTSTRLEPGEDRNGNGKIDTFSGLNDLVVTGNGGDGLRVIADGGAGPASLVTIERLTNNTATGNVGNGGSLNAVNGGRIQVASLTTIDPPGVNRLVPLTGNAFNNNGGNGLLFNSDGTGSLIRAQVGPTPSAATGSVIGTTAPSNTFNNNGQSTAGGSGLRMVANNSGQIQSAVFSNQANGNGNRSTGITTLPGGKVVLLPGSTELNRDSGFSFEIDNGGLISLSTPTNPLLGFNNNEANGNRLNGINIRNGNGGVFQTPAISFNNFNNNGAANMFLGGQSTGPLAFNRITSIDSNLFNRTASGTMGIEFDTRNVLTTNATGGPVLLTRNSFTGRLATGGTTPNAGSQQGIGGIVSGIVPPPPVTPPGTPPGTAPFAGVNLQLGTDDLSLVNSFTNNQDAQIGLTFAGNSLSNVVINRGHSFSNTTNFSDSTTSDTTPDFLGEGIQYRLRDSAVLDGRISGSLFEENASSAIRVGVQGNDPASPATLRNFTVGGTGPSDGNIIRRNNTAGLQVNPITTISNLNTAAVQFERFGVGAIGGNMNDGDPVNDLPVNIIGNVISENRANGISMAATGTDSIDGYRVIGNNIVSNAMNGIRIFVQADADITSFIDNNLICFNGTGGSATGPGNVTPGVNVPDQGNGIAVFESVNSSTDTRSVRGNWTNNTIVGNRDDGIRLAASTTGLVIGSTTGLTDGNLINDNGRNGIRITGSAAGGLTIGGNTIAGNGTTQGVVNGTTVEVAGINAADHAPNLDLRLISNRITRNNGDGVQFGIGGGFSGFTSQLFMQGNVVDQNAGRGVDVVNRGSNTTIVNMQSNLITGNGMEGVYFVNTSSASQTMANTTFLAGNAGAALDATGSVFEIPRLIITMADNSITGNGANSQFYATGLVVRVGTSDGGLGFLSPGGFATNGAGSVINGGVFMTADRNTILGNNGYDVLFQSFVSTVNPIATGGVWSPTEFRVDAYESDPLARLDLVWRNNVFGANSGDRTLGLNNSDGVGSINPSQVAFYNNGEGTFKSRVNSADPPGPFDNAARRRNAQRLAARLPPFLNPTTPTPLAAAFLYPGTGASTFRISADSDATGFLLDDAPFTNSVNSPNGFIWGGATIGELPFGWGRF